MQQSNVSTVEFQPASASNPGDEYFIHSEVKPTDRLLTIREAAVLTGLSVGTLYHFVSANRIPHVRISSRCVRFRYSKLLEWFEKMSQPAKS